MPSQEPASTRFADAAWREIRYSLRGLAKSPVFALTAVAVLAIGIGGTTAVFTLVRAVLLEPLPYPAADRLIYLDQRMSLRRYEATRESASSLGQTGAFLGWPEDMILSMGGAPEGLEGARVSANFLDILGTRPLLGRGFLEEDDRPTGRSVAMISAGLWKRRFGADPLVAGKVALLDEVPHTIVGVLPAGFAFPFPETDVWVTRPSETSALAQQYRRFVTTLFIFGRLAPGVTLGQAKSEMDALNQRYVAEYPKRLDGRPGFVVTTRPLKEWVVSDVRLLLWTILGAVAFVLLIACANIAGLILTRASSRSHQFSVRSALGATTGRLASSLLVEGTLLAVAGGGMGTALAHAAVTHLPGLSGLDLPRVAGAEVDGAILGLTAAISIVTGVFVGLFPALRVSRRASSALLAGHGPTGLRRSSTWKSSALGIRVQELLVAAQIALSVALLIGAAALLQSFVRLLNVELGFEPRNLLTMKLSLPPSRFETAERRAAFYAALERRVLSLPGISHAALMRTLPTTPTLSTNVSVVGRPAVPARDQLKARLQCVTSDYFSAMGIPLLRGRPFAVSDDSRDAPPTIIINESLARHFWPAYPSGPNPVGQRMGEGADRIASAEIVGIVGDARQAGPAESPGPEFYIPMAFHAPRVSYLAARIAGEPGSALAMIRNAVLEVDAGQTVFDVRMMDEILDAKLGQPRLAMHLFVAFALIAVVLATVGLYGTITQFVVARSSEFGLRRALGARRLDIVALVFGRALRLTAAGVAVGTAGALALIRTMQSLMFEVSPSDPATLISAASVTLATALGAVLIPALRAARIQPLAALRDQ